MTLCSCSVGCGMSRPNVSYVILMVRVATHILLGNIYTATARATASGSIHIVRMVPSVDAHPYVYASHCIYNMSVVMYIVIH